MNPPVWKNTTSSAGVAPVLQPSASKNRRDRSRSRTPRVMRLTRCSMADPSLAPFQVRLEENIAVMLYSPHERRSADQRGPAEGRVDPSRAGPPGGDHAVRDRSGRAGPD